MTDFFRFPHTPHLAWLGEGHPRDDKVLSPAEAKRILAHEVQVEEKVDGANLGFSVDDQGELYLQNRGTYLSADTCHPQFKPLFRWIEPRRETLIDSLFPNLMLFGEWCYAMHSIRYTKLPDWFLAFDIYDRSRQEFWSTTRRNDFVQGLGLALVPRLGEGCFDIKKLQAMLQQSQLSDGPAEGLYVRRDDGDQLLARAKLVRPEFAQAIEEHWSRRTLKTNLLINGVSWR